ncbi:MAG: FtsW/RodA/SpoVE family cell cycle protein [Bacteroidales bacterium]|nr:FtsW/RodA/SpoVE family cell cycle protein [Bacteroidales bacterium]
MNWKLSFPKRKFYHTIYVVLVLLCFISLFASYSLTGEIWSTLLEWGLGLLIVLLTQKINYKRLNKGASFFLLASFVLLIVTVIFGSGGGGRSLTVGGHAIQTFYIVTVGVIFYLCTSLARKLMRQEQISRGDAIGLMVLISIFCGLMALRNLSMAILLFVTAVSLLYVAGVNLRYIGIYFVIIIVAGAAYLWHGSVKESRRLADATTTEESKDRGSTAFNRVKYWATGESDSEGYGRQMTLARTAVARSSHWPQPGKGLIKNKMAEGENDFVFSLICEELSVWVAFFIVLTYIILFYNATFVARKAKGNFVKFFSLSIGILIATQAFIHIGTNVNLIPATGQTLPFISRGLTSLLVTFGLVGMLINMARQVESKADPDDQDLMLE